MESIRRVVTGHDDQGMAVVIDDATVEPITLSLLPGFKNVELWHTDDTPSMDGGLGGPGVPVYFPPTGGSVLRVITFPPDGTGLLAPDFDYAAAFEEAESKVPALMARMEPDHPGMHTTDTVDYAIVIEGEIVLELDNGVTTTLRPGTVVVQRGTRHAWRNPSERPATVAFVQLGATPAS